MITVSIPVNKFAAANPTGQTCKSRKNSHKYKTPRKTSAIREESVKNIVVIERTITVIKIKKTNSVMPETVL